MRLAIIFAVAAALALTTTASAEISGDVVKIGVLNDMSGLYADLGGQGSVEAAQMAIADFGGSVNGKKIELISADHQGPCAKLNQGCKDHLEVTLGARVENMQLHPERTRRFLKVSRLGLGNSGICRIEEQRQDGPIEA